MEERAPRVPATAAVYSRALPAYITSLPAFNQPGSQVALRCCRILGKGYCALAAVLRSLGELEDRHDDQQSIARINTARRETGRWIAESWTESQWLDSVPWRFRSDLWPGSSYQHTVTAMTEGKVNEYLEPAFLWPTSAKLKVGVFLVVDGQPRARAEGVELYHIGEQQAYSDYIVLMLSSGHFESCGVLTASGGLQLRLRGTALWSGLWLLHARRTLRQSPQLAMRTSLVRIRTGREWRSCQLEQCRQPFLLLWLRLLSTSPVAHSRRLPLQLLDARLVLRAVGRPLRPASGAEGPLRSACKLLPLALRLPRQLPEGKLWGRQITLPLVKHSCRLHQRLRHRLKASPPWRSWQLTACCTTSSRSATCRSGSACAARRSMRTAWPARRETAQGRLRL